MLKNRDLKTNKFFCPWNKYPWFCCQVLHIETFVQVEVESQNEGRDLELEESQIHQYDNLKKEAAQRSTNLNVEIEKFLREQQNDQEKYSFC